MLGNGLQNAVAIALFSIPLTHAFSASGSEPLRVQIFPHIGSYSTPQGRENQIDSFSFDSSGICSVQAADGDPIHPQPISRVSRSGKRLSFTLTSQRYPALVTCDAPATLRRESRLSSYRYTGSFLIRSAVNASGRRFLQVVNFIEMEDYLRGVVPSEAESSWPMETLKAQAVAARTYALFQVLAIRSSNPDAPYDLEDTVQDQAYLGLSTAAPETDLAVSSTRGEVLTYLGKPIKAFFFGDSGGYTEDAKQVWGEDVPYCRAKPEIYDLSLTPETNWNSTFTYVTLASKLIGASLLPKGSIVTGASVSPSDRDPSGRAATVQLILGNGNTVPIAGTAFRYALGIRSTLFSLTAASTQVSIQGRGFGHGVGMSQLGAKVLAASLGWDYRQILSFYYSGIEFSPTP